MPLALLNQEHNYLEKLKPKSERARFDVESFEVPSMPEGAKFISSFSFTPSHVEATWKMQEPVTSSDFAHGDPKYGTVFGERVSRDVNRNVLLHSLVVFVGNESEEAHVVLNEATRDGNAGFDHRLTTDNSDADKGGAAGFKKVFKSANQRLDYLHRVNTISETPAANGGGAVGVEFYKKAFGARSLTLLAAVKSTMPPKTASLLGKVPDPQQYPVAAADGGATGNTSSSPSESWNCAALKARSCHFAGAVRELVHAEGARYASSKAAATACEALLPRRIHDEHAGAALAASRISIANVVFLDADKHVALVPTCTDPTKMARVDLREVKNGGPAACDRLCMVLKKIPCPHVHVAAVKAGVDLLSITSPDLKTALWKQQYEGMDFPLPSNAQIEAHADLYDESICLHPALKRPKGRPKSTKRKAGYMEKQGKKRIFTCQVCYKAGHTKKTCPNRANPGGPAPWGGGT